MVLESEPFATIDEEEDAVLLDPAALIEDCPAVAIDARLGGEPTRLTTRWSLFGHYLTETIPYPAVLSQSCLFHPFVNYSNLF